MNPILFALPVFVLTIVLEVWWLQKKGRQTYSLADAINSLHAGILSQVTGAFTKVMTFGLYVLAFDQIATTQWDVSSPLAWIVAALLYDLCYYWQHRLGHEMRILWAAHVVHHSSEHYHLATALRQSSTGWLFGWVFYLPMAIVGVPPLMFAIVGLVNLLYQYWVHTETVGQLGWFDRVFVSPSNHRVHHGQNDYCIDKNYGGMLIVWDRLFGTFAAEKTDEKIIYGVRKPLQSFNPLWTNLHLYRDIWLDIKAAPTWSAKWRTLIDPPAGWSNEHLDTFDATQFTPYQVAASTPIQLWALLLYLINMFGLVFFLYGFASWDWPGRIALALWILLSLVIPGAWLEGKSWAKPLEIVRWASLPLVLSSLNLI